MQLSDLLYLEVRRSRRGIVGGNENEGLEMGEQNGDYWQNKKGNDSNEYAKGGDNGRVV